jgi:hypothetical protein
MATEQIVDAAGIDPRIDRLYRNLPAIHRIRDAEHGYPLQALLRVIAEQVNIVEDDIARLYDNWFIETADDWAVPYIADLLGYRPVPEAGASARGTDAAGRALNRVLVPRREVAQLIRSRRRKGTIALLEDLAFDVAGWPARAVECFRRLDRAQHLNHPHYHRLGTASMNAMAALDMIGSPFDLHAHSADVRRANSRHRQGGHGIPGVGVFVWRLRSHPVTRTPAYCAEDIGAHCFTFSVLGQDAPLYRKPVAEPCGSHLAEEANLPVPIRRRALEADLAAEVPALYGEGRSFAIWADQWGGHDGARPLPASVLIAADLGDWRYTPKRGRVAVDPVLGRIKFPPGQLPKRGVRVSYHYGFPADMGGGEYPRDLHAWTPREIEFEAVKAEADPAAWRARLDAEPDATVVYPVGEDTPMPRIGDALRQWREDMPRHAIIELRNSGVWVEPIHVRMRPGQALSLRAASGVRPVIRLIDWQTDLPDALTVELERGSRFELDGLIVTGRPVHVSAPRDPTRYAAQAATTPVCGGELVIRHCTLVPGWGIGCDCAPERPAEPSLELHRLQARVRIEHSILGSIQVHQDEVRSDPIALSIADSIVDAADDEDEAIGAATTAVAHVVLTALRSTFFGTVEVHAVQLVENSIFNDCLNVARRQVGCMRFSYVCRHCRTPRRYRCQPDVAVADAVANVRARKLPAADEALAVAQATAQAAERVRPHYQSRRYGGPGYARLAADCPDEIRRGADDASEMGVHHDLYQPQREANLRARIDEYTPAGMTVGLFLAD